MSLKTYHWLHRRWGEIFRTADPRCGMPPTETGRDDPMLTSRRSTLAAGGSGLVAAQMAGTGRVLAQPRADDIASVLARGSEQANAALMRGDVGRYRALVAVTHDLTLMSPFGGTPTRGAEMTEERWAAMTRFFANGTLEQEVVQAYGSADMVVLAVIERARVEVGGLPAQDWALRVTRVYRREGDGWRLAHRHADPLAKGVSLRQAAALARGEAA